jgi:glycine cleavage system transcriptional repressor
MSEQLVITALGRDRPGIVEELSDALGSRQMNIEDSRMSVLGGEFAIMLLVSGSGEAIRDFIEELAGLEQTLDMKLLAKATTLPQEQPTLVPYQVEVVAMDHPGIVHDLARFFSGRKINIVSLETERYPAAHTGTPMFGMRMVIGIPADQPIARLRDEFITTCDALNLDATMTPAG